MIKLLLDKQISPQMPDFAATRAMTAQRGTFQLHHNSANIGQIEMFFSQKCNYFSKEKTWHHSFLSHSP